MAKDWVPCFGYGQIANVAVPPFSGPTQFVVPLVGTGLGVDPAGNQVGVPDTDPDELTVHRTIGQVKMINQLIDQPTELLVRLRFTTALFNATLGALFPFTIDLESGADANEGFMSERRIVLDTPGVWTHSMFVDPKWSHWDITTKRTLRSAEWTCLVVDVEPFGDSELTSVLSFGHNLRSWVTTK